MPRTAIRHTLSALAAAALVSAFAGSPASAQQLFSDEIVVTATKRQKVEPEGSPVIFDHSGLITQGAMNPNTPNGLAAQQGSQEPSRNRMFTRQIVPKLDKIRK